VTPSTNKKNLLAKNNLGAKKTVDLVALERAKIQVQIKDVVEQIT
jgi:hypothetical protein